MTTNTTAEVSEAMIEAARYALFDVGMARTHLVQPVNGACDYFYVSFAGQRIEFRVDENDELHSPYDQEMARLTAKASACATAINDLLFDLAKKAACKALAMQSERLKGDGEVERLRQLEALISEASIERLAEDIAVACVDCRAEITDARHRAMVRLGERLRNPLPNDLRRLSPPPDGVSR